jgi:hypothetical protein
MKKNRVKATHQIVLPIPLHPTNLAVQLTTDGTTRATVIAVLARLLLEAAASERVEEVSDES